MGNAGNTPFVPVLTVMVDYGNAPFLWLVDGSRATSKRLDRELAGGVRRACHSGRSVGSSSGYPRRKALGTATLLLPRSHAGYA
jgi:hypothetical protein